MDRSSSAHLKLDHASLYLILLSIVLFTIESHPALKPYERILTYLDYGIVFFFTCEYLYRFYLASNKKSFVFSFFSIIDLLSIVPYWFSFGLADLRWLRIVRLARVFRILKVVRYMKAVDRLKRALWNIKEELLVFSFLSSLVIYLAAVGVYYFEKDAQPEHFKSIIHSLWWAVVTLTTVGYGDVYPVTAMGKLFTGIILFVGLGMISIPSGLLASSFQDIFRHDQKHE